jgi:hypothetical protein
MDERYEVWIAPHGAGKSDHSPITRPPTVAPRMTRANAFGRVAATRITV